MDDTTQRFFVLTGGPGAGKTTLIERLRQAGFATTREAGRRVIRAESGIEGRALPWGDPVLFAELMLFAEMESFASARETEGPVFFDRGIPDCLGYLDLCDIEPPEHFRRAAERMRYRSTAFLCPPWAEIFQRDAERRQDFAEAMRTCDAMRRVYAAYGYDVIDVPMGTPEDRTSFVLSAVSAA